MYTRLFIPLFIIFLFYSSQSFSQDLMDLLEDGSEKKTELVEATFKTTRLVNGQSIENPANGVLVFIISHRFGKINQGAYEMFGLDQAFMRLGFEYGVDDRLAVGIGRSTYQKTVDGFLKYKILRQSKGDKAMPFSLTYFAAMTVNTLKWADPDRTNYETSRYAYVHQLLLAKKINREISLQFTPTLVHRNLVPTKADENDVFAAGFGGRLKLTNRTSVNAEYFYILPGTTADDFKNSLSLGFDIETGGHVFQLIFSNGQHQFERAFITETQGDWTKGDIFFGFNLTRVFTVKKPKAFRE
ncbi:MAG: DUF5777 family beta-barrel protein [Bacteroidales bacterium]